MSELSIEFSQRLLSLLWPNLIMTVELVDASDTLLAAEALLNPQVIDGWAVADHVWFNTPLVGDVDKIIIRDDSTMDIVATIDKAQGKPTPSTQLPFWLVWQGQGIFRL